MPDVWSGQARSAEKARTLQSRLMDGGKTTETGSHRPSPKGRMNLKKVPGIESIIPEEFQQRSMNLVRAAIAGDVNVRSGRPAILGSIGAGLGAKFLDRFKTSCQEPRAALESVRHVGLIDTGGVHPVDLETGYGCCGRR